MLLLSRLFQGRAETQRKPQADADERTGESPTPAEERAQALRYEAMDLLARVLIATPRPSADVAEKGRSILDRLESEEAIARSRESARRRWEFSR